MLRPFEQLSASVATVLLEIEVSLVDMPVELVPLKEGLAAVLARRILLLLALII